jgi:hypothetical protein
MRVYPGDCPKCGSPNARYQKTETDLVLVCWCGYRKVVFTTLLSLEVIHNEKAQDVRLPKAGTYLFATLSCLWQIEPANSREVTDTLVLHGHDFTVSDVSSYLMILRSRGLVTVVDYKRGVADGSTWECSDAALDLLGIK